MNRRMTESPMPRKDREERAQVGPGRPPAIPIRSCSGGAEGLLVTRFGFGSPSTGPRRPRRTDSFALRPRFVRTSPAPRSQRVSLSFLKEFTRMQKNLPECRRGSGRGGRRRYRFIRTLGRGASAGPKNRPERLHSPVQNTQAPRGNVDVGVRRQKPTPQVRTNR